MKNKSLSFLAGISLYVALPVMALNIADVAFADVSFPVEEMGSQISEVSSIPIFLPDSLPLSRTVYYDGEFDRNSYSIQLSAVPNCRGTACFIGSLQAEKGGTPIAAPSPGESRVEFKQIQLARGISGRFHNRCGAYCTALLEWQYQGVLYRVTLKNGRLEELQEIANRAIQAGPRSVQAKVSRPSLILQEQGSLGPGSNVLSSDNSYYEQYSFVGQAGQSVLITLESEDFDTYLAIFDADGKLLAENDDINQNNSNSQISVTLPRSGRYRVIVNTYDREGRGRYTLTIR